MKKILLINEKKEFENVSAGWPHLGLISFGTVLKQNGFDVRVVDFAFLKNSKSALEICKEFNPDIVGISLYTTTWSCCDKLLTEVDENINAVIVVGGPHATIYYQDLLEDRRIDIIMTGEVEEKIVEVCRSATKQERPKLINCGFVDTKELPRLDYTIADQHGRIEEIGIQLERGCPFNCVFCSVRKISSRKVRYRLTENCIIEIRENIKHMPKLKTVRIVDDCPSFRLDLFKKFMRQFIEEFPYLQINIQHLRADQVDEEMILLLKKAHLRSLTIGVESANPTVFKFVDKGETLEQIETTAKMLKKHGLRLTLAFVLGLPYSTYERELDSIKLAKKIKPHEIYWNMCVPHKGNRLWDWYEEHGTIYIDRFPSTLIDSNLQFDTPRAETPEFPLFEREKVWVKAVLETKSFRFRISLLPRIIHLVKYYGLWSSFSTMLFDVHNLVYISRDISMNTLRVLGLFDFARAVVYRIRNFKSI